VVSTGTLWYISGALFVFAFCLGFGPVVEWGTITLHSSTILCGPKWWGHTASEMSNTIACLLMLGSALACCVFCYYKIWAHLKANMYKPPAPKAQPTPPRSSSVAGAQIAMATANMTVIAIAAAPVALAATLVPAPATETNNATSPVTSTTSDRSPAIRPPGHVRHTSLISSDEKRENDIASKMLVLPAGFVMCWTGYFIKILWELFSGQPCLADWDAFATAGPTINGVLNPLLYCYINDHVRRQCLAALSSVFCCGTGAGGSVPVYPSDAISMSAAPPALTLTKPAPGSPASPASPVAAGSQMVVVLPASRRRSM
jgi:hypothetical protein